MSESVAVEQSWTEKVTDMVAKLVDAPKIKWGSHGLWRSPHVIALADFVLPSVDSYTIEEGTKVFVDKDTYPAGPYRLSDGRTIPVANVTMSMSPAKPTPVEGDAPESAESGITFYVGTVSTAYRYEPSRLTVRRGELAYLDTEAEENEAGFLVKDAYSAKFQGRVRAASAQKRDVGDTVPSHDTATIELMCFELYPYAAMRADLLSPAKFFKQLTAERRDSGSEDWAKFFGANLSEGSRIKDLENFKRGEMIILYNRRFSADHTVIASGKVDEGGGGHLVYSLSHSPKENPGLWPIRTICDTNLTAEPFAYAIAFTPKPPS